MTHRRTNAVRNATLALIAIATIVWAAFKLSGAAAVPPRFAVVEPSVLYRSAQPTTRQLQTMIDRFGLPTLLIVREGGSQRVTDEIDFARRRGLNVVHIPVESRRPIPQAQIDEFFRCVDDRRNYPILVHCSAGRHR